MTFRELELLLEQYDAKKGFRRRLFGDAKPIKILKAFIEAAGFNGDPNTDVLISDYLSFAENSGYFPDLSDNYLNSGTASATLFRQWKRNEQFAQSLNFSFIQISQRLRDDLMPRIPAIIISSIASLDSLQINTAPENNFITRYLEEQQNPIMSVIDRDTPFLINHMAFFQYRNTDFRRPQPQPQHAAATRDFSCGSAAPAA